MNFRSFALVLASALAASTLSASTISTGTVAPWLVNGNPAVVETSIAAPFWINNFGDGRWVGTDANAGGLTSTAAAGTYTYTLNLGAYIGSNGSFSLQYAADNAVLWSITNGSLAGSANCAGPDCFSSVGGAPRSLTGTFAADSVLTAQLTNTAIGPTGLLVVGTADAAFVGAAPTPEPSTFLMLGLGGAALLAARRRK
jgi:hypothetical protein